MIQLLSRLEVADNTGAKKVRMIRRLGQNKKTASVGDIIVCHVKVLPTERINLSSGRPRLIVKLRIVSFRRARHDLSSRAAAEIGVIRVSAPGGKN